MSFEETIAEVTLLDGVGCRAIPVDILTSSGRLNEERTVLALFDARIVQRVDVDGHAHGVL